MSSRGEGGVSVFLLGEGEVEGYGGGEVVWVTP